MFHQSSRQTHNVFKPNDTCKFKSVLYFEVQGYHQNKLAQLLLSLQVKIFSENKFQPLKAKQGTQTIADNPAVCRV